MIGTVTSSSLEHINTEREAVVASMKRYLEYLNTLMPSDAEWLRARGYLLYLAGQLEELNTAERVALQEFFKSSTEAALDCITLR